jgi:hypothetical protein
MAKLKKYKSPGSDQILTELIQARGEIVLPAIHKLINSIWNKEELPDQRKESIIVPIHKKGDKTDCNNYRGISLLSYKILWNILPSRLSPYLNEIIGGHQCFFFFYTFVYLAIPSLQLRLTTSLFSNLHSKLKANSQYLSIDQCRVLVLICSHILLRSCLAQIPLALCSAFSSDHYAH